MCCRTPGGRLADGDEIPLAGRLRCATAGRRPARFRERALRRRRRPSVALVTPRAQPGASVSCYAQAILALGDDLAGVWSAATTTDKDRKRLLRTPLDEVAISVHRDRDEGHADLALRWEGGGSPTCPCPSNARRRGGYAPARTLLTCYAAWPSTIWIPRCALTDAMWQVLGDESGLNVFGDSAYADADTLDDLEEQGRVLLIALTPAGPAR